MSIICTDALETMSSLAALSGMRIEDVSAFTLACYDFDGQRELCVDEVTLALKSLSLGLCKVAKAPIPKEQLLEALVSKVNISSRTLNMYIMVAVSVIRRSFGP
jgi:hypothetical protein